MSSQWEDAFNEAVERRVRMLKAAELVESWSCCGQTFTGTADFISGARSAHVCDDAIRADERERLSARVYENGWCPTCAATPAPASPDERLREALRTMIDVYDRHDRWCGLLRPGDGIIHRIDGARNALAAADREKPDEDQT